MVAAIQPGQLRHSPEGFGKLIDVRSAADFATGHIPGAVNVPMEQIESRYEDLGTGPVLLVCEGGTRAGIVAGWLERRQPVAVLSGGTAAWKKADYPLVKCAVARWGLERQVRFTAGLIVLFATVMSVLVNRGWVYLAMFLGAGLTFAGATNVCGMAVVLAKMPWNRRPGKATGVTGMRAQCGS
jgi:rhodanese-related sulfurtransferase